MERHEGGGIEVKPRPEDWVNIGGLMAMAGEATKAQAVVKVYCAEFGLDFGEVDAVVQRAANVANRVSGEEKA